VPLSRRGHKPNIGADNLLRLYGRSTRCVPFLTAAGSFPTADQRFQPAAFAHRVRHAIFRRLRLTLPGVNAAHIYASATTACRQPPRPHAARSFLTRTDAAKGRRHTELRSARGGLRDVLP